jgi:type IV pilus assembly protein PilC
MLFQYSGKTRSGEGREGTIKASHREEALSLLRKQGIIVTSISEKESAFGNIGGRGKVKDKDLAIFTKQFSVMIDSGLPLVQCLEALASQQENKTFQKALFQVRADVEGGSTLADALGKQDHIFNNLYVNMVAAGEAGGILDIIMQRLAIYIEKAYKLQSAFKSAMIYPTTVIVAAGLIIAIILWKVIPAFETMFQGLGAELPLPTKIVVAMSNFLVSFGWLVVLGIFAVIFAIKQYYKTQGGRHLIDSIMLKLPILGVILRKIAVARFSRTLSTLVSSGVPILEGLLITAKTAGNAIIEDAIMDTRKAVETGKEIADPLKDSGVFPPMVVQMISVGEATGALDAMLSKVADFYEDEVDTAVAGLMSLLEPVMIIILGGAVGGIVVAMYLPIFKIIQHI